MIASLWLPAFIHSEVTWLPGWEDDDSTGGKTLYRALGLVGWSSPAIHWTTSDSKLTFEHCCNSMVPTSTEVWALTLDTSLMPPSINTPSLTYTALMWHDIDICEMSIQTLDIKDIMMLCAYLGIKLHDGTETVDVDILHYCIASCSYPVNTHCKTLN